MLDWLNYTEIWDNSIAHWALIAVIAALVYLLVFGGMRLARSKVREQQARAPSTPQAVVLALLVATRRLVLFLLAVLLAARMLELPSALESLNRHVVFVLVGLQIAFWTNGLIELWFENSLKPGRIRFNPVIASILGWAAQVMVWAVLLMFVLANLGVNITAFVASLGVGGIAVALAAQNILGDLFASAAIGLDKPFEVGQFIAFGKELGTVNHVGIKTTRITSLSGEQLVISNTQLLTQLIRNYGRMNERRVVFTFRVPYGTPRERVEAIPPRVRALFEKEEQVRFDRAHLANFGEYGLEFEVVYYVLNPDFMLYRDIQQRANLGIMALFEEFGIEFAVPARTVTVYGMQRERPGRDNVRELRQAVLHHPEPVAGGQS